MINEKEYMFSVVMNDGTPSETALTAAAARAAHLIVDREPAIFADTRAYALLGERAEELLGYHRAHGDHPILAGARAAVVTRSRFTEDRLAAAVRRGIDQYVILGAGLDSFAYRGGPDRRIRVFEVDHPATQRWKRGLLARAGIGVPDGVTFVPADFETGALAGALAANGFDPERPAFVGWLGVTMYLTPDAVGDVVAALGRLARGTEIVVDYMLPEHLRDDAGRAYAEAVMAVAAERGEPWLAFFAPEEMSALLERHGCGPVAHVGQRASVPPDLWDRTDSLRPSALSMLAHTAVR